GRNSVQAAQRDAVDTGLPPPDRRRSTAVPGSPGGQAACWTISSASIDAPVVRTRRSSYGCKQPDMRLELRCNECACRELPSVFAGNGKLAIVADPGAIRDEYTLSKHDVRPNLRIGTDRYARRQPRKATQSRPC